MPRSPRADRLGGLVGACVAGVTLVGLTVGAVHGGRTVAGLGAPASLRAARLDSAYYHCIDVQARSLVGDGEPVRLSAPDLADYYTLLKAVGRWVTFAPRATPSTVTLSLGPHPGRGACLGVAVEASRRLPDGRVVVRRGSGASVPGSGPPPVLPF